MRQAQMLFHFGVKPYFVFDGDALPSKSQTNTQRATNRAHHKKIGLDLLKAGKTSQAHQELKQAISISTAMVRQVIEALRQASIDYVVAPYEADAQLVYMEREGLIDGIISEDSDLLVFGAKKLLTKLDQFGECTEICRDDFAACKEINLTGWSDREFRQMAILSGCDYLQQVPKLGLRTAHRLMRKYHKAERVIQILRLNKNYTVPSGYEDAFNRAEMTFLHQRVYDPVKRRPIHFTEPDGPLADDVLAVLGSEQSIETVRAVCRGDLDPKSKTVLPVPKLSKIYLVPKHGSRLLTGSSIDSKMGVPIKQFFAPKRTPLAELDPNSLQYTTSQQALLRRHTSAGWEAVPVREIENRRVSAPPLRLNESENGIMPTQPSARASPGPRRIDRSHTPKRPRLCSDPQPDPLDSVSDQKSRFFSTSKKPRLSIMKSDEIRVRVWTDEQDEVPLDSSPEALTAERNSQPMPTSSAAMQSQAMLTTTSKVVKPLYHTVKRQELKLRSRASVDARREPMRSTHHLQKRYSLASTTASTCRPGATFDKPGSGLSRFAYPTPDPTQEERQVSKVSVLTPPVCFVRTHSLPTPLVSRSLADAKSVTGRPMTPLQRLGLGALSKRTVSASQPAAVPGSMAPGQAEELELGLPGAQPSIVSSSWPEITDNGCDVRDESDDETYRDADAYDGQPMPSQRVSAEDEEEIADSEAGDETVSPAEWGIPDFMKRYGYPTV